MRRLALAAFLCLAGGSAVASTFQRVELPALVQHATNGIVQGRVLSTSASWDDNQQVIFTSAIFRVDVSLAGPVQAGDTIVVREAGGEVDGFTVDAIAFPRFVAGDELVLFLGPTWEDGDHRVADYGAGFYEVSRKGGQPVLVQGPLQDSIPTPAPIEPGTPLTHLVAALRALPR